MGRAWVVLVLLAGETVTPSAKAASGSFTWHGPDCLGGAPLLESRLGELVGPHERERLAGSVAVKRHLDRYAVEVSIELDGRALGTRKLEAATCARAAETAAVAASLAVYDGEGAPPAAAANGISPDIWTRRPDPQPDFSQAAPAAPAPPPPLLEARLGAFALLDIGTLPEPAAGGALELGLGVGRRWSLSVQGSLTASQQRSVGEQQSVSLSALGGAVRGCAAPIVADLYRVDACAGARVAQARGRGNGLVTSRSASLTWAAPLAGVDLALRSPQHLEWRLELEGAVPLSRRRFLVDGSEVARSSSVVGALRIGALVRF